MAGQGARAKEGEGQGSKLYCSKEQGYKKQSTGAEEQQSTPFENFVPLLDGYSRLIQIKCCNIKLKCVLNDLLSHHFHTASCVESFESAALPHASAGSRESRNHIKLHTILMALFYLIQLQICFIYTTVFAWTLTWGLDVIPHRRLVSGAASASSSPSPSD